MVFVKSQKSKDMKANIEKHIPSALEQIKSFYTANHDQPIKKEYKSYLSSLGASIIMSGLLPTLAVYYSEEGKADRTVVIKWVFNIVKPLHGNCNGKTDLLKYAIQIDSDSILKEILTEDIKNISIALKLAIRTFPLTK